MKYLVLFREPDGRTEKHSEEEIQKHQLHWKNWFATVSQQGKLTGGCGLTLQGCLIKGNGDVITHDIHKNGTEIIGGYLLLNAHDLEDAKQTMMTCPIYEFGGYAEIRELQNQS